MKRSLTERNPFPRKRYDSDNSMNSRNNSTLQKQKKTSRRKRYDSDDSVVTDKKIETFAGVKGEKERTTSGHTAGLQNSQNFRDTELKIQERNRKDAQLMVDKYGVGETIYRDHLGKHDSSDRKKTKHSLTREQEENLNTGKVQKYQEREMLQNYRNLQQSTFARYADDTALEAMKKEIIRKDDPMANYSRKKSDISTENSGKLIYKGPASKPNRFGICPGYRWDGVDRGNGFEDQVLAKKYSKAYKEEQLYRWSTSDM
jgi:pre-mRNA-splicing factor CWC26